METDALTFQVSATARGNALTVDGDGELTLRLAVPACDRAAVLALLDALQAGDGRIIQLVAVLDRPAPFEDYSDYDDALEMAMQGGGQ